MEGMIVKRNRRFMIPRVSVAALSLLVLLLFYPGCTLSADVMLDSFELYNTHQWIERKPAIHFKCKGENKTSLPDVEEANVLYHFNGEESWQPLTDLHSRKCKRCKLYEDLFMTRHTFDEWELCSSNFEAPNGIYIHKKEKEFKATFLCKECLSITADPPLSEKHHPTNVKHYFVSILTTLLVVSVIFLSLVAVLKHLRNKRRRREQARFHKLFEDDDDMEDELGLRQMV